MTTIAYEDSEGGRALKHLKDLSVPIHPGNVVVFGNSKESDFDIELFRFIIFNNSSQLMQRQLQFSEQSPRFKLIDDCELRSSFYKQASECLECATKVLNENSICFDYCSEFFKNPRTYQCFQCISSNCDEIQKTTFEVKRVEKEHYRIRPTKQILTQAIDFNKQIDITFQSEENKPYQFIVKREINLGKQTVDFYFDFKEKTIDDKLQFVIFNDPNNPFYDLDRNQLFHGTNRLVKTVDVNTTTEGICYFSKEREKTINTFVIITFIFLLIAFILLALFSIFCGRVLPLGELWKVFLHNWMRLQLISLFVLLGVYLPCCA